MFGLQKQSHKNRVEIDTEHSLKRNISFLEYFEYFKQYLLREWRF